MRDRRGSEVIEFALVMPVLVALIAGVIDYGWFFTQRLGVSQAAEMGARTGALSSELDPAERAFQAASEVLDQWGIPGATVTVRLVPMVTGGSTLEVHVTAPFDPLFHLVPLPTDLASGAEVWMETQPVAQIAG